MNKENFIYPERFVDAEGLLADKLDAYPVINMTSYLNSHYRRTDIENYSIQLIKTDDDYSDDDDTAYSNLLLALDYRMVYVNENGMFPMRKSRTLRLFCPHGDKKWTYRMVQKVWEGEYPSTVALDIESGEVFFFCIKDLGIELIDFGYIPKSQLEFFDDTVNDREPYTVKIDDDAMFDYIDGAEGLHHLKRNVIITFNASTPIVVRHEVRMPDIPVETEL